jgi:succinoglycan biosynthesis protein ExoA
MEKLPFITISMPVRNEADFIEHALQQLLDQDYPEDRYEIIVADGLSTDATRLKVNAVATNNKQVRLLSNPGIFPSSGRNVGFKNGKGDFFVVVDGHCKISNKSFLKDIADAFARSQADCLGRPQPFIIPEEETTQRAIAIARSSSLGHSANSLIHSAEEGFFSPVSMGCAYSKKVFQTIGYLDEHFDACEDVEFNYRVEKAGFKCFFTPKIALQYYPRATFSGLFFQLMRYGEGRASFLFKHREAMDIDVLKPVVLVLGITLGWVSVLINDHLFYAYLFCVFSYAILLSYHAVKLRTNESAVFTFKIFFAFLVTHFSLGIGLLKGVAMNLFRKK